jgi:hypothetical protein
MMQQEHKKIKESEVEDALVSNLRILKTLLGFHIEPRLIARQLRLGDESRIDLLLSCGDHLALIELKVTEFHPTYKEQVIRYRKAVEGLQFQKEMPSGEILSYLLVTDYTPDQLRDCIIDKVYLIRYSPESILEAYYLQLWTSTPFLRIRPKDYGVFNLGLMNRTLAELQRGETTEGSISEKNNLSRNTTRLHLRTASEFGLVRKRNHNYFLTDLGDRYASLHHQGKLQNQISDEQSELLRQYIAKSPFASGMVFGVYAIVESAFFLARNSYPIEFTDLINTFIMVSGKTLEWKKERSRTTATYTFLNFAIDLGLLGKIGSRVVITPSGFRFILMLQLHKSIEMIESLQK